MGTRGRTSNRTNTFQLGFIAIYFSPLYFFVSWASFAFQSFFATLAIFAFHLYSSHSTSPNPTPSSSQSWRVQLSQTSLYPNSAAKRGQQHLFKVWRGRPSCERESFDLRHTNSSKQVMSDILGCESQLQGTKRRELADTISCLSSRLVVVAVVLYDTTTTASGHAEQGNRACQICDGKRDTSDSRAVKSKNLKVVDKDRQSAAIKTRIQTSFSFPRCKYIMRTQVHNSCLYCTVFFR